MDDYIHRAKEHGLDLHDVPLFLSSHGVQLTPKAFREGCWNPACHSVGIDADVHQTRHWYVTQAIRGIYESARSESEIHRRSRELIEYMGWKSGWETLDAYQHYFDPQRHAEIQDRLHRRMDQALKEDLKKLSSTRAAIASHSTAIRAVETADRPSEDDARDSDLEYLLALGGRHEVGNGE